MSKVLPAFFYGDPANTVEYQKKQERGCRGCRHHIKAWDIIGCDLHRKPHAGGYCKRWQE